jgi:hypothetical protein
MWSPPQLPKHGVAEIVDSSLNGLVRDVDSYISELSTTEENSAVPTVATPTRAQSLQQRQSPRMAFSRSNTTYRPPAYVSLVITA